jgi:HD-GYP domain-containing protein (c-di-GMP phosphodiesterase class II)
MALALALRQSEEHSVEVAEAARLRDIGEFGLPEELLRKPGALSDEEWALIREHPISGERLLCTIGKLDTLADTIAHHHERFDGGGYPEGLKGTEIPLAARIVTVASAFHALVTKRPYRD